MSARINYTIESDPCVPNLYWAFAQTDKGDIYTRAETVVALETSIMQRAIALGYSVCDIILIRSE
jgi:hypothetical protein